MKKACLILLILHILIMLIYVQHYFVSHSLFRKYPYTGILLHLIGGGCIYIFAIVSIKEVFKSFVLGKLVRISLLTVLVAEICWECTEVVLGWNDRQKVMYYLYNTAEDVLVTLIGALLIAMAELYIFSSEKSC